MSGLVEDGERKVSGLVEEEERKVDEWVGGGGGEEGG